MDRGVPTEEVLAEMRADFPSSVGFYFRSGCADTGGIEFQDRCLKPFRHLSDEPVDGNGCIHRSAAPVIHDAAPPARSTRRAMLQRCTSEGRS